MPTQKFRIGDKVQTPEGVGFVLMYSLFIDEYRKKPAAEAMAFANTCRRIYGDDFQSDYMLVLVASVKGKSKWFEAYQLKPLVSVPRDL